MTDDDSPDEIDVSDYANDEILIIAGITAVFHQPTIQTAEVSTTGKTIQCPAFTGDATKRLDTETILRGEAEHRGPCYYTLFTPERFVSKEQSNYDPAGEGVVEAADVEDLPDPTHRPVE